MIKKPTKIEIYEDRRLKEDPYAHLMGDGTFDALPGKILPDRPSAPLQISLDLIRERSVPRRTGIHRRQYSKQEIGAIVNRFHRAIWRKRSQICAAGLMDDPHRLLNPELALDMIGYQFELVGSLGEASLDHRSSRVAGCVDFDSRRVQISERFSSQVQRFTAAHELGHIVLHPGTGMHRDRPRETSQVELQRDPVELEADIFASLFLMPDKLVRTEFRNRFGGSRFVLNDDSLFALDPAKHRKGIGSIADIRSLSRMVAGATRFGHLRFVSLAEQFGVSVEAMAIRLEELDLIVQ